MSVSVFGSLMFLVPIASVYVSKYFLAIYCEWGKETQHGIRKTAAAAKSLQSCLSLWDSMDCSPDFSVLGFSRQEYWSRLPCPLPEDLPDPGTKLVSLMSSALAGGFCTTGTTWEVHTLWYPCHFFSFMLLIHHFSKFKISNNTT